MPEPDNAIHQGDIGTELVVAVTDEDGAAVNIASASALTVYLTLPAVGTAAPVTLTKTGTLDTTGADGLLKYTTVDGDLSVPGTWHIQARVTLGGNRWSTRETSFQVKASRGGA